MPRGIYKHKPLTEEHRRNIGLGLLKLKRKHSAESRKKMSIAQIGNKKSLGKKWSVESRIAFSKKMKGKPPLHWVGKHHTEETRRKMSEKLKVVFASRRKDNRTENYRQRRSVENKIWREKVYQRDDYTCQHCGERGGKLNADHIKPFSLFPELRFELSNGRTLCVPCHRKTPTWGGNAGKSLFTNNTI